MVASPTSPINTRGNRALARVVATRSRFPPAAAPLASKPDLSAPYPRPAARSPNAWLFVAIALAVFCLCGGGILVALLLPAVQASREAARRMQCSNNLKQIGLAMHNYHDVYKGFPAAYIADENGKPLHSWRVALLPYLEQQHLYEQYNFNEPWDSPNNLQVAQQMPEVFRCPDAPSAPGSNLTNYVVIVGDPSQKPIQSLFLPNHWTNFSEITDGTSNTIMVVETSTSSPLDAARCGSEVRSDRSPGRDGPCGLGECSSRWCQRDHG